MTRWTTALFIVGAFAAGTLLTLWLTRNAAMTTGTLSTDVRPGSVVVADHTGRVEIKPSGVYVYVGDDLVAGVHRIMSHDQPCGVIFVRDDKGQRAYRGCQLNTSD